MRCDDLSANLKRSFLLLPKSKFLNPFATSIKIRFASDTTRIAGFVFLFNASGPLLAFLTLLRNTIERSSASRVRRNRFVAYCKVLVGVNCPRKSIISLHNVHSIVIILCFRSNVSPNFFSYNIHRKDIYGMQNVSMNSLFYLISL